MGSGVGGPAVEDVLHDAAGVPGRAAVVVEELPGVGVRPVTARPGDAGQLRAIVGVEVRIDRVEAKWKLSQNRSAADVDGVVTGLTADGETATATAVQAARG